LVGEEKRREEKRRDEKRKEGEWDGREIDRFQTF
jgi:hypothetical protein